MPNAVSAAGAGGGWMSKLGSEPLTSDALTENDYVRTILDIYLSIPNTPERPRRDDRFMATRLYRQGVPLYEFECALLLGCARRELQEHEESLQPIRSLRYFSPLLDEVRSESVDTRYVRYLREKLSGLLRPKIPKKKRVRARDIARQLRLRW